MYHKHVIAKVARRLPHRTRRDVAEIIELLTKIWSDKLVNGGEIILPDIGQLSIEVQQMQAGGALVKHGQLCRMYGRFLPTTALKRRIEEALYDET